MSFIAGRNYSQPGAKLFYFPDEKEALEKLPSHNIPQVTADLGEINPYHFGSADNETDDEFCFLGDDAMFPKDGVPEITWFSQDVNIVENHLAKPDGKKGMLFENNNIYVNSIPDDLQCSSPLTELNSSQQQNYFILLRFQIKKIWDPKIFASHFSIVKLPESLRFPEGLDDAKSLEYQLIYVLVLMHTAEKSFEPG